MNIYLKNKAILVSVLIINLLGILVVYSSQGATTTWYLHLAYIFIGWILFYITSKIDFSFYKSRLSIFSAQIISIIVLIVLLFTPLAGPNRWIVFGELTFQPAEIIKIIISLGVAVAIITSKSNKWIKYILANIACIVLIILQPSLGNGLVTLSLLILPAIYFSKNTYFYLYSILVGLTIFAATATNTLLGIIAFCIFIILAALIFRKKRFNLYFLITLASALFIAGNFSNYIWENTLTDYQKVRIESFINQGSDPLGSGWQVDQSVRAISAGRLLGTGYLQGEQTRSGFLAYSHTDFAYASFNEQFGNIGAIVLILTYVYLIYILINKIEDYNLSVSNILLFNLAMLIFVSTVIAISTNIGILPVTGIPLPYLSYGGSSIIANFIFLGIIFSGLKYRENNLFD